MIKSISASALLLLVLAAQSALAQRPTLVIYWIDVEGGAATLIVTPAGESVLMDAGWNTPDERDADRIEAAMGDAGITGIDYFIASHFHGDHTGGVTALAARTRIGQFIDHGDSVEQANPSSRAAWDAYIGAAGTNRRTIVPGDKLSLAGIDFTFVVARREVLGRAIGQARENSYCAGTTAGEDIEGENSNSLGYLLSLGNFQFLNLGDLTVNIQHELVCPQNLLGAVDVFQVPHHGNGVAPQLTWAVSPTAAVLNNGPRKGGSPEGFEAVDTIPDIRAIWQLHRALGTDAAHNAKEQLTANLTEENDQGFWIKASINADGRSYTIENARNNYREAYLSR